MHLAESVLRAWSSAVCCLVCWLLAGVGVGDPAVCAPALAVGRWFGAGFCLQDVSRWFGVIQLWLAVPGTCGGALRQAELLGIGLQGCC